MSIRDYGNKLYRLLKQFAGDPDPEVVLQRVLRERIIQTLPKDARAFVRNQEPETMSKACCLAEQYFSVAQHLALPPSVEWHAGKVA